MIKGYRKRFVQLNMILAEAVLIAVLLLLGIYLGFRYRDNLRFTLRQVLSPFDFLAPGTGFFPSEGETPGGMPGMPDMPADVPGENGEFPNEAINPRGSMIDLGGQERQVSALIYSPSSRSLLRITDSLGLSDTELLKIAQEAEAMEGDFGFLRKSRFFCCKEPQGNELRIALAPASVLFTDLLRMILILLGVFVAASALFLLISIRLSRYAARPMEQALQMERQFAADISHDLKTPITVIKANNSILKSEPEKTVGEEMQWLDNTDAAADSMLSLVGEMLTLSRLDSVVAGEELVPTDFSAAVLRAVIQLESVAFEHNVVIEDDIAEGIKVRATAEYLNRIAADLLENALKYEPEGGKVLVTLKQRKKTVLFTVRSEGSVISEEDLPHVFERFYRAGKSRSDRKGHGLGLSIIRRITEILGGEISVRSSSEEGTSFTVTLNTAES